MKRKITRQEAYDKTQEKLVETLDKLILLELNSDLLTEDKRVLLEVSFWDKAKFYMSKLGRYKAGGKILGKRGVDAAANEKILQIMSKKGNETLKALHDEIQKLNKSKDSDGKEGRGVFPNNEDPQIFLNIVLAISAVYDSIVASTKKDSKEEGFLPIDMANNLIMDLREYVKKYLDVDLAMSGSITDSEEEQDDVIVEDEESDVRDKLKAKKKGDEKIDSQRMDTLKSNKLPAILALAGGSLAALGWLAQTEWLKSLIEVWLNTPGTEGTAAVTEAVNYAPDVEGMVHWMSDAGGKAIENGGDVAEFIKKFGAENVSHMFDGNGAGDAMDQMGKLQELVSGDGASKSVGELFTSDTFGDMKGGRNLFGISKAASFVKTVVIKSAVKAVAAGTAGTILATKLAAIGTVLLPLGIGLLTTGALVKIMRVKGQKQSRAATLNDLLQSLQKVKPTNDNPPVIKIPPREKEPPVDPPEKEKPPVDEVPAEFLKGNRNMQLINLSKTFLPQGKDLWSNLGLKSGTVMPSGFFDAALGQGKVDGEKYLRAFYNHLKKDGSFTSPVDTDEWLNKVKSSESSSQIKWVRNTRKNIGGFLKALSNLFPEFNLGNRAKATTSKPGERGKAMATAGAENASILGRSNIITETNLGKLANSAGFNQDVFMKNLPKFIEMLSMMYYSTKGTKLPYDKEAVLAACKDYGCKGGSDKKYDKTKSKDYNIQQESQLDGRLVEEITKIKKLINYK